MAVICDRDPGSLAFPLETEPYTSAIGSNAVVDQIGDSSRQGIPGRPHRLDHRRRIRCYVVEFLETRIGIIGHWFHSSWVWIESEVATHVPYSLSNQFSPFRSKRPPVNRYNGDE